MIFNYYSKDFVLKTKQNRATQVVTSSSVCYNRWSVEILDELGWDNLETQRTRQLATIMYKLKNHIAPDHLAQIFNSTNSMYPYNLLRNSKHFNIFVCTKTEYWGWEKQLSRLRGGWNSLWNTVKRQTS